MSGRLEYQGYFGKNKYTVTYSENVGEYPHRTLKNYFSRGLAVKYRLPRANRRRWEIRASYNRVEKGDGTRPESIGLDLLHALPLGPGELRFGLHRRWKGNVDWLEVYTDEETAGNGGYKRVDVKWTWRLGHKNTWWLGGELTDYDDGFLGSQLDLGRDWQLGQVFFQTRLFTTIINPEPMQGVGSRQRITLNNVTKNESVKRLFQIAVNESGSRRSACS